LATKTTKTAKSTTPKEPKTAKSDKQAETPVAKKKNPTTIADRKSDILAVPTTMEELLAQMGQKVKTFKRGVVVTGKVSDITGRTIYIDVGGKTEAIIAEAEYETSREYLMTLKVGDEITGTVISPESESGQIVLSLRRAAADSRWKTFEEALESGSIITVKGKEATRGGLLVEAEGMFGFVPASQLSKQWADKVEQLAGQAVQVKVIEVDRNENRLVLSEKAVTEAEEIEARKKALAAVKIGGEYKGTVVGLVPFGAFVEIKASKGKTAETLEGLVHISELSWEKVDDVSKALNVGDNVSVQVIGVDEDTGKLALSVKRMTDDPWKNMAKNYSVDSKHSGKVVKIAPYGVFVNLAKGVEGLIHASKMPAEMAFAEGQEVEVFVESVDMDKRRLSLGVVVKDTKSMIYK
jgi:small subunit ribosomal protein S1